MDQRPDPEALLARVQSEAPQRNRGRLKIFFGASAGVGKTYAMLQEAQERCRAGAEVVVGYVETHKRPETLALLDGLEQLPPKWVEYRGVRLREFDLDAALTRKPSLVLVDELAHTNAEGLRHAKRWQDVIELLDAGIDVYSTVNVQHVESLNDVIAQITGIVIRETIPDSIVERADEIELIDLPPDDLLQRLKEGKVYVPAQAERATQLFFKRETLVALRELALRLTADRVNAQVQIERAGQAIDRTWATAERLLVCVGPSPLSARVIRVARRMAAAQRCDWFAVAVETPMQGAEATDHIRRNMRLAERLGADGVTLSGESVAAELLAYARKRNVTRIVIGKPSLPRWREWLRGSIVDELIRRSGDIDVHVVKGEPDERSGVNRSKTPSPTNRRQYAWVLGIMTACTLLAWMAFPLFSPVNLTMIYLAGVVFIATRCDLRPSLMACILAVLFFDFFFVPPHLTFAVSDAQYLVTFVVMLATAVTVSGLTQRVRRQADAARTRYQRTAALYFMSRMLAGAADKPSVVRVAARHTADVFGGEVVILIPDLHGSLIPSDAPGEWFSSSPNEPAAAQWVFQNQKWAGRGTDTLPACRGFYVHLVASGKPLGVLGVRIAEGSAGLEPDQRHMLETFATQLAIALERADFAEQAQNARVQAESEQLRSSLLSSVSHDLRTPLSTITGAASTLLNERKNLSPQTEKELLEAIQDEGIRLNQFVGKLLDMTRLEAPTMQLAKDWFPLEELVGSALRRLDVALAGHKIETDVPSELPLVLVDGVLIEEVFINLLENAARYTPRGTLVRMSARQIGDFIRVEIADNGPGLQPGTEATLFHKFFRDRPKTDRSGTGLGLSICEAVVRLHGGKMGAMNLPEGGACFWFELPVPKEAPPAMTESALISASTADRKDK